MRTSIIRTALLSLAAALSLMITACAASSPVSYSYTSSVPGISDGTITVEATGHTAATLSYTDDAGILTEYTPFAKISLADGKGSFKIVGSHAFPEEATGIRAVFEDGSSADYAIPAEHRFPENDKPLYTYYQVSDMHICAGNDYWPEMTVNRENLAKDVISHDPAFVLVAGDIVNNASDGFWGSVQSYFDRHFNRNGIIALPVHGNHAFYITDKKNENYDRAGMLSFYDKQLSYAADLGVTVEHEEEKLYYTAFIDGNKYIFLSVPSPLDDYKISPEQLDYLDEMLYREERSDKTTFIIMHCGPASGLANTGDFDAVLARHPNVLVATGHTHLNLDVNRASGGGQAARVGDMTKTYTYFNDGCSVWLSGAENGAQYEKGFSTGQVVEVYEDKIILKARKFLNESQFIGHCLFQVNLPKKDDSLPTVSISGGTPKDGVTLTAMVNGKEATSDYRCEWLIGASIVSRESTWKVDASMKYVGKPVFLRVYNQNGGYVSCVSDAPVGGCKVSFDLNGGEGVLPEPICAENGETVSLCFDDVILTKNGRYFIGFAANKDASVADSSVTVTKNVTLYAIYSDIPTFSFTSGSCGFIPNAAANAVRKDGHLTFTANGGNPSMTLPNIKADLSAYKYVRLKASYMGGTPEGIYYTTEKSTDFAAERMIPFKDAVSSASVGDMAVFEYPITAKFDGNVTALRFDMLDGSGACVIDDLVFTNKRGIYGVSLVVNADGAVTAAAGADVCTVGSIAWNGPVASVRLAPADGYEFTTKEDVLATVTVDGAAPYDATVEKDGSAVICYKPFDTDVFTLALGSTANGTDTRTVTLEKVRDKGILAIAYDISGKVICDAAASGVTLPDGTLEVSADKARGIKTIRIYVFDKLVTGYPVIQATQIDL